jgi:hypothetical protein
LVLGIGGCIVGAIGAGIFGIWGIIDKRSG